VGDKARRHPAAWREPDTSYQPYILAAQRQHLSEVRWAGIDTYDRALEIRRGLHRARRQLGIPMSAEIYQGSGRSYVVIFRFHDAAEAKRYMQRAGRWNAKQEHQ
jgi:hypothetical protein